MNETQASPEPDPTDDYLEMRLGPVNVLAPPVLPRQIDATHGHLWQWLGDAEPLMNLSVAVRTTQMGTSTGVAHRLNVETAQARELLGGREHSSEPENAFVAVEGCSAMPAAATLHGMRDGLPVLVGIVVTTDGALMHVTQVAAVDTAPGRELVDTVMNSIQVNEWELPREPDDGATPESV